MSTIYVIIIINNYYLCWSSQCCTTHIYPIDGISNHEILSILLCLLCAFIANIFFFSLSFRIVIIKYYLRFYRYEIDEN